MRNFERITGSIAEIMLSEGRLGKAPYQTMMEQLRKYGIRAGKHDDARSNCIDVIGQKFSDLLCNHMQLLIVNGVNQETAIAGTLAYYHVGPEQYETYDRKLTKSRQTATIIPLSKAANA